MLLIMAKGNEIRTIYTMSQKKLQKLFLSELRQISDNFNNFWYVDNRIADV